MITRKKSKYVIVMILLVAWAGGLLGYMEFERYINSKNENAAANPINPIIGVTRDVPIPVLLYHGIVEEEDGTNVTIADFREQMLALKKNDYTAIDTHDLFTYYKEGAELPQKSVVITFDDGRKDSFLNGDPILEEVGFKAVMFVVTKRLESGDAFFLSWDELQHMHQSGRWDIEAHAYESHDLIPIDHNGNMANYGSNKLWIYEENRLETDEEYQNRLLEDLQAAKEHLESHLEGCEVVSYAFPFGDYGQKGINIDKEMAVRTNIDAVRSVYPLSFELNYNCSDLNNYDDSDCSLLERFEVHGDLTAAALIQELTRSGLKRLPYTVMGFDSREEYGWFCNWGRAYAENDCLKLVSDENESGAMAVVYGGHYWSDYTVLADISVVKGRGNLIGRYVDENNYVLCGIDEGSLVLRQKVQGEIYTIEYLEIEEPRDDYRIGLSFKGDTVICKVDDQPVLGPIAIDPHLAKGGVGFNVWNPEEPDAQISIRKVTVFLNRREETKPNEAELMPGGSSLPWCGITTISILEEISMRQTIYSDGKNG